MIIAGNNQLHCYKAVNYKLAGKTVRKLKNAPTAIAASCVKKKKKKKTSKLLVVKLLFLYLYLLIHVFKMCAVKNHPHFFYPYLGVFFYYLCSS